MKIALITGIGRKEGIGYETAKQLGLLGYHVIMTARLIDQVKPLSEELNNQGLKTTALILDLVDEESIKKVIKYIDDNFCKLDVLINNAARMKMSPSSILEKDLDELEEEFRINVIGTWRFTREIFPLLSKSEHGRIENVSSGAGSFWDPDYGLVNYPGFALAKFGEFPISGYALTKLALNGLTIKMAKEFKHSKILVNSVCPGMTATYEGAEAWARSVKESVKGILWASTLPDDGPTGWFFRDCKLIPW